MRKIDKEQSLPIAYFKLVVLMMTTLLATACNKKDNSIDKTPLTIGSVILESRAVMSRGLDDSFNWKWDIDDEIEIKADHTSQTDYTATLKYDGTNWKWKNTPIYLQDVDGTTDGEEKYKFTVTPIGTTNTDQSLITNYTNTDKIMGVGVITDKQLNLTLTHNTIDFVITIKKNNGWASEAEFVDNMKTASIALFNNEASLYSIVPYTITTTDGAKTIYRAHMDKVWLNNTTPDQIVTGVALAELTYTPVGSVSSKVLKVKYNRPANLALGSRISLNILLDKLAGIEDISATLEDYVESDEGIIDGEREPNP